MNNIVFGLFTILLCLTGYYYAWRNTGKGHYQIAIGLIVLCGFLLRIYVCADFYLHEWDERYHALVAKNLINNPLIPTLYENPILPYDYRNWTSNHIWLHKQPVPLWTMALSMRIFGIHEIALRLPSVLITTIGIWLTYKIGKYLYNNRIGIIAAFLYSIHGLIIELSGGRMPTDHIDIFFLFFIELAIFFATRFALKKYFYFNILCGISVGAAILSKWLPALIVLPIWLLIMLDTKKFTLKELIIHFSLLIITIALIAAPWQIYISRVFPGEAAWERSYNIMHIYKSLRTDSDPFYYHFNKLRIIYGEIVYIPIVWFGWKYLKNLKNYKSLMLLTWFLIPFVFFSFVKTKMQAYTLFTAPAIFIITAAFWNYLFEHKHLFKYKIIVYIILFLLIALPVRYSIERIKPFKRDRYPLYIREIKHLNRQYGNKKAVFFNMDYPIETMFYTDFVAYQCIPEPETIRELINKGFTIVVNDKGNLKKEIIELKNIDIIKLTPKNK